MPKAYQSWVLYTQTCYKQHWILLRSSFYASCTDTILFYSIRSSQTVKGKTSHQTMIAGQRKTGKFITFGAILTTTHLFVKSRSHERVEHQRTVAWAVCLPLLLVTMVSWWGVVATFDLFMDICIPVLESFVDTCHMKIFGPTTKCILNCLPPVLSAGRE